MFGEAGRALRRTNWGSGMDGPALPRLRRGSGLQPLAKALLTAGALGLMIGGPAAMAQAPAVMTPYALPLAAGGAAALIAGLLFSGAAALERRLIEAELALIETREELRAAVDALRSAPARTDREPMFRSRPDRRRMRRPA
jgi:hypothetical protein